MIFRPFSFSEESVSSTRLFFHDQVTVLSIKGTLNRLTVPWKQLLQTWHKNVRLNDIDVMPTTDRALFIASLHGFVLYYLQYLVHLGIIDITY